ncbi:MAG: TolC family protein [Rhodocyclaceae bacterium]|nr:TolC family protein [Rhodocyclaceae bacterium]
MRSFPSLFLFALFALFAALIAPAHAQDDALPPPPPSPWRWFSPSTYTQDEALQPSQATRAGEPSFASEAAFLSQQTIELTLSDAIYLGLRNNRAIRSSYLDRIAQKFDLRVAEDGFTPKLNVRGGFRQENDSEAPASSHSSLRPNATMLTPYGTRFSLGWTYRRDHSGASSGLVNDGANLEVIQPLLKGAQGAATIDVRRARLQESRNRLGLKSTLSETITQIIAAYWKLLQAQEKVHIAQASLKRSLQLLETNHSLIDAGRMAAIEIVQTEAEVATQELSYEEARNQQDMERLSLLQLLALDLDTMIVASEAPVAEPLSISALEALRRAETSQPAYLSQLVSGELAKIDLEQARNNRLWDVSLVGGASQVRNLGGNPNSRFWNNYVGVQVEFPLGDLAPRQAEVQAQVKEQNQELKIAEARQQLERDVINSVRNIYTRWRQYEIAQRALDLSRKKLDIEREKLAVGRSSNFQVLSFENDLRNAENAQLNALISYLNAQAELDQTLGTTLESWDISLNDGDD